MEGLVDSAKKFMNTEEGQNMVAQAEKSFGRQGGATGDAQPGSSDNNNNQQQQGSTDAFGNAGAPGQFGQQGQYGAVTGQGFGAGAGLAKDRDGKPLGGGGQQQGSGERERRMSAYEGYDGDSTASGGWGRNAQGGSFSRQNQMGADNTNAAFGNGGDDSDNEGYKTGTSTPGYRQEGDVDGDADKRNANMNVYGDQADDLRPQNDKNEQSPQI